MTTSQPMFAAIRDDETVRLTARELLAGWHDAAAELTCRPERRAVAPLAFGLAAYTHDCLEAYLLLIESRHTLPAVALVRAGFEASLTCMWLVQLRGAPEALLREELRQRRLLAEAIKKARPDVDLQVLAEIARDSFEAPPSESSARVFQGICDDLTPGGPAAYWHYRALSGLAHPSVTLADRYLAPAKERDVPALLLAPRPQPAQAAWTYLLTCSAYWAGLAVNYLDESRRRREDLRAAHKVLGCAETLQMSAAAWIRVNKPRVQQS